MTTRYNQTPRKAHKRTLMDDLERKINPNFKSKKIHKSEYDGDWPFYADEVTIESRHKNWYVITIDNYDYALNGSAKGRYKLENPQDGGMVIMDKDFAAFLELAKKL